MIKSTQKYAILVVEMAFSVKLLFSIRGKSLPSKPVIAGFGKE